VQKSAVEELTAVSRQDFPILTTAMPINAQNRDLALGIIILQLIVVAIAALFSTIPLAHVDAFIPVVQTVMCVVDLITAAFLFGQFLVRPKYALLVIASGYVFSGLFAFAQTLAFPGAYSATGLIGDGVSSAAWLFVLWHGSFDLAVIVYALSKGVDEKDVDEADNPSIRSNAALNRTR
jgi:Membrane-associated sensor, integral membrane domain